MYQVPPILSQDLLHRRESQGNRRSGQEKKRKEWTCKNCRGGGTNIDSSRQLEQPDDQQPQTADIPTPPHEEETPITTTI